jgi:hypothetical protein
MRAFISAVIMRFITRAATTVVIMPTTRRAVTWAAEGTGLRVPANLEVKAVQPGRVRASNRME